MKFPKKFYVEKSIEVELYDNTPSDTLDADRYLQGKPFFLHEREIKRPTPKKIILRDSFLNQDLTAIEVENFIYDLLDHGFEVYAQHPNNDRLLKLDREIYHLYFHENLIKSYIADSDYCFNFNGRIKCELLPIIAGKNLNVPESEILILDELTIQAYVKKIPPDGKIPFLIQDFHWDTIPRLRELSNINTEDFHRIIIKSIVEDEDKLSILSSLLPMNTPIMKYTRVTKDVSHSISELLALKQKDSAKNNEFDADHHQSLEWLAMKKNILTNRNLTLTVNEIFAILDHCPQLNSLTVFLKSSEPTTEMQDLVQTTSNSLVELIILSLITRSEAKYLNRLLASLPNLERLTLSLETIDDIDFSQLPKLTTLFLHCQSINETLLIKLKQCRHLKDVTLYLKDERPIDYEISAFGKNSGGLISIEHLHLHLKHNSANLEMLEDFIQLMPNLKLLWLGSNSNIESSIPAVERKALTDAPPDARLTNKIKHLYVDNINFNPETFLPCLLGRAQLDRLILMKCQLHFLDNPVKLSFPIRCQNLTLKNIVFKSNTLPKFISLFHQSISSLLIFDAKCDPAHDEGKARAISTLPLKSTLREIRLFNFKEPLPGMSELLESSTLTHLSIVNNTLNPIPKVNLTNEINTTLAISMEALQHQPSLALKPYHLVVDLDTHLDIHDNTNVNLVTAPNVKALTITLTDLNLIGGIKESNIRIRLITELLNIATETEVLTLYISSVFNIFKALTDTLIESNIKQLNRLKYIRFSCMRHESPSPSQLLRIAPNLEYIFYKDILISKKRFYSSKNLCDPNDRDTLPEIIADNTPTDLISNLSHVRFPFLPSAYSEDSTGAINKNGELLSNEMNQSVIIDKLYRYLELTQQLTKHDETILSKGICSSLAHLYQHVSDAEWDQLINTISAFTGKADQLSEPTRLAFELCTRFYRKYNGEMFLELSIPSYFIAGSIKSLLSKLKIGDATILTNLNHAVCVRKVEINSFYLYDPEVPDGRPKEYNIDDLIQQVSIYILGKLIFSEDDVEISESSFSIWPSTNEFIADGGLSALCCNQRLRDYYKLHHQNDLYDDESCLKALTIGGSEHVPNTFINMLVTKELEWLLSKLLQQLFLNKTIKESKSHLKRLLDSPAPFDDYDKSIISSKFISEDAIFSTYLDDELRSYAQAILNYNHTTLPETLTSAFSDLTSINTIKEELSDGEEKSILFTNSTKLARFILYTQAHLIKMNRAVFLIQDDADLDYHASVPVRDEDNQALLALHPLRVFIEENKNSKDALIIINCEHLSLSMMMKFEELFSNEFTPMINRLILITEDNPLLPALQEQFDLFSNIKPYGNENQDFLDTSPLNIAIEKTITDDDYVIELFNSTHWKEMLLGQWQIIGDKLIYQEGVISAALTQDKPVVLSNAPWSNQKFVAFLEQALMTRKINNAGRLITIPETMHFKAITGYNHLHLGDCVSVKQGFSPNAPILNPYTLRLFYLKHQADQTTKTLKLLPGIIEEVERSESKVLQVNLSHTLKDDELARFIATCAEHYLQLEIYTLEKDHVSSLVAVEIQDYTHENQNRISVFVSEDYDATSLKIIYDHPELTYTVYSVIGCKCDDLLDHIIAETVDSKSMRNPFQFESIKGVVNEALERGEHIILKGEFSDDLAQALATWLLDPNFKHADHLILVTNSHKPFNYQKVNFLDIDDEEKFKLICKELGTDELDQLPDDWRGNTLSQMRAKLIYKAANHGENPWQGLNRLPLSLDPTPLNPSTYKNEAQQFNEARYQSIMDIFKYSPFVFIAGITGVGKTLFINKVLKKRQIHVFNEANDIENWANCSENGLKVLFMDEFNIGINEGDEFENLFNEHPSILHPKTHIRLPLTKQHKVIFAGNPINYSTNRHMPRFIDRHGCSVVFDPITPAYLYKAILKPLCKKHPDLKKISLPICEQYLAVYRYACLLSQDDVLMTPRELSMMAMLTIAAYNNDPSINPINAAAYYAYTLALPNIPLEYHVVFDLHFKPDSSLIQTGNDAFFLIKEILNLRNLRQTHSDD